MERQWRQPVACSRNATARPICAALGGDSRRCQYAYLQSSTIDDARPHSMTDIYFTGARRRKFEHFKTSVRPPPLLAPSGVWCHSPTVVSVLCGAQLRSFTVLEPLLSADKNRQCVIVALMSTQHRSGSVNISVATRQQTLMSLLDLSIAETFGY